MPVEGTFGEETPLLGYASALRTEKVGPADGGEAYRAGDVLVATDGAMLSPRCILCGEEADGAPMQLSFSWDNSFRMTRRTTLQMGRKACVHARLCKMHRRRWNRGRIAGVGGLLGCAGLTIGGVCIAAFSEASQVPVYAADGIWLIVAGFAGMILFLFWFALRTRTLACDRIEDGYLYLAGAAPQFLATLPELPDRPA